MVEIKVMPAGEGFNCASSVSRRSESRNEFIIRALWLRASGLGNKTMCVHQSRKLVSWKQSRENLLRYGGATIGVGIYLNPKQLQAIGNTHLNFFELISTRKIYKLQIVIETHCEINFSTRYQFQKNEKWTDK